MEAEYSSGGVDLGNVRLGAVSAAGMAWQYPELVSAVQTSHGRQAPEAAGPAFPRAVDPAHDTAVTEVDVMNPLCPCVQPQPATHG